MGTAAVDAGSDDVEELRPGYVPGEWADPRAAGTGKAHHQTRKTTSFGWGLPTHSGLGLPLQTGSSSSSSLSDFITQHGRPPIPDNSVSMSPNLHNDGLGGGDEQPNQLPVTVDDEDEIMPVEGWHDRDIEITLDNGCCNYVLHAEDAPGYLVNESPGSRRGSASGTVNECRMKGRRVCEWRPPWARDK